MLWRVLPTFFNPLLMPSASKLCLDCKRSFRLL